ncbi:MAG: GNAT family N-acetyltransferase [Planctomycetota bacterium]
MPIVTQIDGPESVGAAEAEAVLRTLPEWFGIESALIGYAQQAGKGMTFTARHSGALVGFATVRRHFATSGEITCIAVRREDRGTGIGRLLVDAAQRWLVSEGVRWLQVKTLAESNPDPNYAQTRRFYLSQGFEPLEEMPGLWGDANPCLIMVKTLSK